MHDNKVRGVLVAIVSDEDTNVVEATVHTPIEYFQADLGVTLAYDDGGQEQV